MKFSINVVYVDDSGAEQPHRLMPLSRHELAMETLGLTLAEGKELLYALQDYMTDRQVVAHLEHHRACAQCEKRFASNG